MSPQPSRFFFLVWPRLCHGGCGLRSEWVGVIRGGDGGGAPREFQTCRQGRSRSQGSGAFQYLVLGGGGASLDLSVLLVSSLGRCIWHGTAPKLPPANVDNGKNDSLLSSGRRRLRRRRERREEKRRRNGVRRRQRSKSRRRRRRNPDHLRRLRARLTAGDVPLALSDS